MPNINLLLIFRVSKVQYLGILKFFPSVGFPFLGNIKLVPCNFNGEIFLLNRYWKSLKRGNIMQPKCMLQCRIESHLESSY